MRIADLTVGQAVEFRPVGLNGGRWRVGTVRALSRHRGGPEARVDDGDPANGDPRTNGFKLSAWCGSREVRPVTKDPHHVRDLGIPQREGGDWSPVKDGS